MSGFWNVSEDYSTIPHFQKALKSFLKVIDCTQQLKVRENVVGFEKALGAVKVIKDRIQYRSQSLLNLACGYFRIRLGFDHLRELKHCHNLSNLHLECTQKQWFSS